MKDAAQHNDNVSLDEGERIGIYMDMVKTTFEGEELPHRLLWEIVEEQVTLASEREQGWSKPALVAMVFAFHAVEAYLNFIGERLAPQIWQDEQNYFHKEPYRGWNGKLRKVMELVGLPWPQPVSQPLSTIIELKDLRDVIAHAKPERFTGEIDHAEDTLSLFYVSKLRAMFTPKEKLTRAVHDVEQFLNQIHGLAAPKVKDPWFGKEALRGPSQYSSHTTTLSR